MLRLLKRKARILVLDDDPSMQRLVSTILRRQGYRVEIVSGGSQAIERIAEKAYDALLLDVMTPTEGATTVIRYLREMQPAMLRRVILVTASPDSILRTVAADAFAVVHKPFTPAELTGAVERLLAS
jgi:CheY-like chemotaxis protein